MGLIWSKSNFILKTTLNIEYWTIFTALKGNDHEQTQKKNKSIVVTKIQEYSIKLIYSMLHSESKIKSLKIIKIENSEIWMFLIENLKDNLLEIFVLRYF